MEFHPADRTDPVPQEKIHLTSKVEVTPFHGGPDGERVAGGALAHLEYLSFVARELGVPDPVEEYFGPVVGRWNDMHEQAAAWREAARGIEEIVDDLNRPLGGLDAVWEGADCDAFLEHMRQVGLAGGDLSDAMVVMADALDATADAIRQLVTDLVDVLADSAESVSEALMVPMLGEQRAREHLDEKAQSLREIFEAVREVLEAFAQLCDGIDAGGGFAEVAMEHTFPEQNFTFDIELPETPDAAGGADAGSGVHGLGAAEPAGSGPTGAAGGAGAVGGGGGGGGGFSGAGETVAPQPPRTITPPPGYSAAAFAPLPQEGGPHPGAAPAAAASGRAAGMPMGGMGMMPMMGGMAGAQGGDSEHRRKVQRTTDPTELFGKPRKSAPSVLGDD
ncbi:MAG TPA: WXG100 family type VII secretion target [Pseudonocardiaceae bacterium]